MKRFISALSAIIFTLSISFSAFANPQRSVSQRVLTPPIWMPYDILVDNENIPLVVDDGMKSKEEMGFCESYGNSLKFTNLVDGYSVVIPSNMTVDLSLSDICATISNSTTTLRIFKETFSTSSERLSYLVYSNKFTENTTNHTLEKNESYTKGSREYHILQWSRKALSRIQNDKNHYMCIDVCEGARVYTFYFTSSQPFSSNFGYMSIVDSLTTFDPVVPSANAYTAGYRKSDLSHLNHSALSTYNYLFSDDAGFKMGIFPPNKYGGFAKMEEFEKAIGCTFAAFLEYTECPDNVGIDSTQYYSKVSSYISTIEQYFHYAQNSGKTLELTLQTPLTRNSGSNMVYDILDGNFDIFLAQYANLIAKYPNVTVLFRPFNEMNGDWCNYSAYHTSRDPQIYIELYKYIYNKFEQAGCKNVIWVWNPNERSFPNYKWNNQSLYYPGDEYVDVYGITGYNNGTYYEGETWRSFDEIYAPIYQKALHINEKPMMITEFSCSSVGGDKVLWVEEMFNTLPNYDKIKLAIWWHAADYNGEQIARPYFMDTPDGMLEVFSKYLN